MDNNNLNEINNNESINTVQTQETIVNDWPEPKKTRDIVKCVVSIANMFIIVPIVGYFALIFAFAGAFSGSMKYIMVTYLGMGYILVSFVCMIVFIWNVAKHSKSARIIFLAILALNALFIFRLGAIATHRSTYDNSNNKLREVEVVTNNLYQDNNVKVELVRFYKSNAFVHLTFRLNNLSDEYYNFNIDKVIVNDQYEMNYKITEGCKLSSPNAFVDPHNNSSNYGIYIYKKNFEEINFKMDDLKKISIKIHLIHAENDYSDAFDIIDVPELLNIEVKE